MWVILLCLVEAEDGHHRVTDELLDHSAVALDDLAPSREVGIDHRTNVLGVELAGHGGEVDEIGEEHRHLLALTTRYAGQDGDTARPQRLEGGLDHHVTQDFPLCFEGGDGVVDR